MGGRWRFARASSPGCAWVQQAAQEGTEAARATRAAGHAVHSKSWPGRCCRRLPAACRPAQPGRIGGARPECLGAPGGRVLACCHCFYSCTAAHAARQPSSSPCLVLPCRRCSALASCQQLAANVLETASVGASGAADAKLMRLCKRRNRVSWRGCRRCALHRRPRLQQEGTSRQTQGPRSASRLPLVQRLVQGLASLASSGARQSVPRLPLRERALTGT